MKLSISWAEPVSYLEGRMAVRWGHGWILACGSLTPSTVIHLKLKHLLPWASACAGLNLLSLEKLCYMRRESKTSNERVDEGMKEFSPHLLSRNTGPTSVKGQWHGALCKIHTSPLMTPGHQSRERQVDQAVTTLQGKSGPGGADECPYYASDINQTDTNPISVAWYDAKWCIFYMTAVVGGEWEGRCVVFWCQEGLDVVYAACTWLQVVHHLPLHLPPRNKGAWMQSL